MKKDRAKKNSDLKPYTIFSYNTIHLLKKDKIRFYYALKGRDGKTGVVKQYQITQLGRTVLLVPQKYAIPVEDFLKYWKCKYRSREAFLRD
ncbi:hypothetical protein J4457_07315 [Candidatus Woesearchaeota archaeon]|nr:hypothetical protein [Candidatus Woesearchaeota archaeon]